MGYRTSHRDAFEAGTPVRELYLAQLAVTERLAAALARLARAGDVLALAGPLGVGKTAFARAFITALGGEEEVPSPTFTLVQLYELGDLTLYHFDLYRLERPEEAYELGIEEAFAEGVTLIEWPERLGPLLPPERLDVALAFAERAHARRVRLTGHGRWARRLAELKA
jgi:tRNA threonylcarbamoyladenosine biosynthesis protein TsaE